MWISRTWRPATALVIATSLVIILITWIATAQYRIRYRSTNSSGDLIDVILVHGKLQFGRYERFLQTHSAGIELREGFSVSSSDHIPANWLLFSGANSETHGAFGFYFVHGRERWAVQIPLWVPSLVSAGAVLGVGWPLVRSRLRRAAGNCSECGYSLKANTSGRCPECGSRIDAGTK